MHLHLPHVSIDTARRWAIGIILVVGLVIMLAACGDATKDAEKSGQQVDRSPAEVIAYPDKFRNVAHKCDGHGHRVYSSSTGDSGNAAQVAVIADPSCSGGQR